jgi:cystathionine beta-lyase
MSAGAGSADDPFGLVSFGPAEAARRPGAKWMRAGGKLAVWVADMDFPVAPAIVERLERRVAVDVGYPGWDELGRSFLPSRFAERMSERYGWSPSVDRIREVTEVMQAVEIAIHHLTEPGDGIVLHTPAYPPFLQSIARTERRLVEVPATDAGGAVAWDYDELERRLAVDPARLWILCHPQNPTGHVFARPELERVAGIAERYDLVVVSDEIHAELVYPPHGHVPFASLSTDAARRTVTVTSSSKAFNLAGLRWGVFHAGVDRLHEQVAALPQHYLGIPNLLAVEATAAAWSDGDAWQRAVVAQLDANRRRLGELLGEHLPTVRYRMPDATYLAWLDCRALGFGDDPAATFAERGVEVYSGLKFGPLGAGFVRLNFATSPTVLEAVVSAMARA